METGIVEPSTLTDLIPNCLTYEKILQNTDQVQCFANNLDDKCSDFWTSIKFLQSKDIEAKFPNETPFFVWEAGKTEFKNCLCEIMATDLLPENVFYSEQEILDFNTKADLAVTLFKETLPTLFKAFQKVCPFILIGRRDGYGGGSVSTRIGFIWLSPTLDWTTNDWAENLIHEFIHNCLFLEDLVDNIFPFSALEMEKEDGLAISAIRQVKRAYDKSYHSAFVAYGIIEFYLRIGHNDGARKLLNPLLVCLDDLSQNFKYLSKNGEHNLDQLIRTVVGQSKRLEKI